MVKTFSPKTKAEALEVLANNNVYILAGGSDLMVMKKNTAGLAPKFDKPVMYISNIDELHYVRDLEDGVHIGATNTLDEIAHDKSTPSLLKKAIGEVASINIRHFATLPGNIANASPAGDTTVVDVLLDAIIVLESKSGIRKVLAKDFVLGVRKIDRHEDEMITEIIFPHHDYNGEMWFKVGSRKADSISKVSVAGAYKVNNGKVEKFALAFGSVSIKVCRSLEIEHEIEGMSISELESKKDSIVEKYSHIISPIDDQRSNKEYRQKVAMNICAEFLNQIIKGGK